MEESQIAALINNGKFVDLKTAFKTVQAYERFFAKYRDNLSWYFVERYLYLTPKIISRYSYKISFEQLSSNKFLQEKTIARYSDKLNWLMLSSNPCLSEDLIRKFQNKVHWERISSRQPLSEKFIKEFKHKVNWCSICQTQNISHKFIKENKEFINFPSLMVNKHFNWTEDFITEFHDELDLNNLIYRRLISFELLKKFHYRVYLPSAVLRIKVSSSFVKNHCANIKNIPLCYFNINRSDSWRTFL
jgi:hypothetical protein